MWKHDTSGSAPAFELPVHAPVTTQHSYSVLPSTTAAPGTRLAPTAVHVTSPSPPMFPVQQELPLGHPTQHASVVLPVVAAASAILLLPSSQVKSEHSCPATHSRVSQITSAGLCAYLALSLALARPLQKKRKVTVAPCVDATKHAAPTKRSTLLRRDITRRPCAAPAPFGDRAPPRLPSPTVLQVERPLGSPSPLARPSQLWRNGP